MPKIIGKGFVLILMALGVKYATELCHQHAVTQQILALEVIQILLPGSKNTRDFSILCYETQPVRVLRAD